MKMIDLLAQRAKRTVEAHEGIKQPTREEAKNFFGFQYNLFLSAWIVNSFADI